MKQAYLIIAVLISFCSIQNEIIAQTVEIKTDKNIKIDYRNGTYGYEMSDLKGHKGKVFERAELAKDESNIIQNLEINLKFLNSSEEVSSAMGYNVNVSGRYLSANFATEIQKQKAEYFNQNTLTFMFDGFAEYGRIDFINQSLTHVADSINKANAKEFIKTYGTYFLSGYNRASSIKVFLKVSNLSSSQQSAFSGNLKANFSSLTTSIDANLSLAELMKAKRNSKDIQINIIASGLNNDQVKSLTQLIDGAFENDEQNIENAIRKAITEYLNKIDKSNSVPNIYYFSPFSNIPGVNLETTFWDDLREQQLGEYCKQYLEINDAANDISKILSSTVYMRFVSSNDKLEFIKYKKLYSDTLRYIETVARKCKMNVNANISECCPKLDFNKPADSLLNKYLYAYFKDLEFEYPDEKTPISILQGDIFSRKIINNKLANNFIKVQLNLKFSPFYSPENVGCKQNVKDVNKYVYEFQLFFNDSLIGRIGCHRENAFYCVNISSETYTNLRLKIPANGEIKFTLKKQNLKFYNDGQQYADCDVDDLLIYQGSKMQIELVE